MNGAASSRFETSIADLVTFGCRLIFPSTGTKRLWSVWNESGLADWSKLTRIAWQLQTLPSAWIKSVWIKSVWIKSV